MPTSRHPSRYCLNCYAPIERPRSASEVCEACGEVNLRQDFQLYWSREPRLRRLEGTLKLLIVLSGLASFALMAFGTRSMHGYAGVGYAIGGPLLTGMILWDTASLLTRRRSAYRLEIVWPLLVAALGLGPLVVFLGAGFVISFEFWTAWTLEGIGYLLLWVGCWSALGWASHWVVGRLARLRARYLASRLVATP